MTAHGHFHWNELQTRDVEASKKFDADTIGWTFNGMDMPDGTYWVAMDGETPLGGIFEMKGSDFEGIPTHWFAYLSVDDVDARLKKAKAAGATVMREPFDVPNVGRITIIQQPDGAHVGWMTPANSG